MNKALEPLLVKLRALSIRERLMIAAAVATVAVFMAETIFLYPLDRQRNAVTHTVDAQQAEIADLEQQLAPLRAARNGDPDAIAQARLREVRARVAAVDRTLEGVEKQLVPPERIPALLEEMLKPHPSLRLVHLRTLPVVPLIKNETANGQEAAGSEAASAGAAGTGGSDAGSPGTSNLAPGTPSEAGAKPRRDGNIFKHGIEITLRGPYLETLDYLAQLEALPLRMYWGVLKLDATDPAGSPTVVLTVYTLSLDKAWLKLSNS
jgi:MSHA biogenesis protein MshJ